MLTWSKIGLKFSINDNCFYNFGVIKVCLNLNKETDDKDIPRIYLFNLIIQKGINVRIRC